MSTLKTGILRADSEIAATMVVASLSSKRRLESSGSKADYPTASKLAKKTFHTESDSHDSLLTNGHEKCSSEFLTTSILARTLLTASNPSLTHCNNGISSSPLESLKSSLEALPAPMFLESMEELHCSSSFLCSVPKTATIKSEDRGDLELNSLLCTERSLSTVTVLSPIDEDFDHHPSSVWNSGFLKMKNPSLPVNFNDQLITEEENGKSYFNLGPSEATVLAKKSSSSTSSSSSNSPPDQSWVSSKSNMDYLDESSSSSSCESISSEDLFNSCEEYDDASEDEEEARTYKQERSAVLHLSLCKLNSFRTQQCVEPSLHRSVLICNTLRHIEQEIRQEDEAKKNESSFLQSRETLPPFWPSASRNAAQNSLQNGQGPPLPSIPTTTQNCHDPYLFSSLYNESPYSTVSSAAAYDYSSPQRPPQTPFHTASYDYRETDLSSSTPHSQQSNILNSGFVSSPAPSILECDSGYDEDLDLSLSSYYYSNPSPSPLTLNKPSILNGSENCYSCNPEDSSYGCTGSTMPDQNFVLAPGNLQASEPHSSVPLPLDTSEKVLKSKDNCTNNNVMSSEVVLGSNKTLENLGKIRNDPPCSAASFVESIETWFSSSAPAAAISSFAQQESQCGMESLRSDFYLSSTNGHSIHHHQLPMDSLISQNYSTT